MKPHRSTPYLYINSNENRSMGYDRWLPSVNEFTPHPLNERVYGSPKPDKTLIESIEKVGILNNRRTQAGRIEGVKLRLIRAWTREEYLLQEVPELPALR